MDAPNAQAWVSVDNIKKSWSWLMNNLLNAQQDARLVIEMTPLNALLVI